MEKCFIRDGYSTVNVGLLDGYGNIYLMKTITEKLHLPNVVLGWEIYLGVETLQTNLRCCAWSMLMCRVLHIGKRLTKKLEVFDVVVQMNS